MADDWQDLALNHRRIPHGKSKKGGKSGGRHGAGVFYPNRAIATYPLKTGNAEVGNGYIPRFNGRTPMDDFRAEFVVHGFTERPGGYVASMVNSTGTFKAAVFMAGSRKLLSEIVRDEEEKASRAGPVDDDEGDESESAREDGIDDQENDDDDHDDNADDDQPPGESELEANDRFYNDRFQAFTKNSFRQPKFWFQWQGEIGKSGPADQDLATPPKTIRERDMGYIVFNTHACESFHGTINSKALGWKNMEIIGGGDRIPVPTAPTFSWNDLAVDPEDEDDGSEEDGKDAGLQGE